MRERNPTPRPTPRKAVTEYDLTELPEMARQLRGLGRLLLSGWNRPGTGVVFTLDPKAFAGGVLREFATRLDALHTRLVAKT